MSERERNDLLRRLKAYCVCEQNMTCHACESFRAIEELQAALADRPEQPVAWRIRWAPDRTTDWIDFAKNPPTGIDRETAESRGTFEYAYAAPVARPEPAQPTNAEIDWAQQYHGAAPITAAQYVAPQEPAQPVAHRQRLRYAFGDVWAYWDDETSQPMVGDQGPVYVGAAHPLYAAQPKTRVSMGWARLDTAGEIIELASDERSGWHEIFRDAYCSCVPSNDGEHGIGCEMHIYAPPSHPAPSEAGAERQSKDDHAAHLEAQRQQRIGASLWGSEGPSYAKPAKGDAS